MKKLAATLLICLLYQFSASAQLVPGDPEKAGFSKAGFERLNKIVQQYVDSQWIAGASMIVAKNGTIVYQQAIGYSDVNSKQKLRTDNIFRIASQTKAITSVGTMILLEQGKLLLSDPVSKYIPAFSKTVVIDKFDGKDSSYTTVPLKRPITIRDLLTHTSGIGYAQIGSNNYKALGFKAGVYSGIGMPYNNLADQVEKIAALPLEHQPGERFTYGLNNDVLGRIIEIVSKQPLDQFFSKQIFEPLGMKDTWFYLPHDKRSRLVALHGEDSLRHVYHITKPVEVSGSYLEPDFPNFDGKMFSGGAGLASTAYDYAIFMEMILNGGVYNGKRILSKNSVKLLTENQINSLFAGDSKFSLAFGVATDKESAKIGLPEGTLSWGGAFSSSYWIDPVNKIVAQMFINQWPNSHPEIHEKFKVQVYSALK